MPTLIRLGRDVIFYKKKVLFGSSQTNVANREEDEEFVEQALMPDTTKDMLSASPRSSRSLQKLTGSGTAGAEPELVGNQNVKSCHVVLYLSLDQTLKEH